ncbi:MAG: hypothetical protein FJX76_04450 [Armatimonadetes bacterium]|nr:hypothetical protein [Armatimonadota bacterium]
MTDLDSPEKLFEQEQMVFQTIRTRLKGSPDLRDEQQEALAYRLAEIMVASRVLYTQVLPRFMEQNDADPLELLGETRMNLLNMRDLVEDFEESFLESLSDRQSEADEEPGSPGNGKHASPEWKAPEPKIDDEDTI